MFQNRDTATSDFRCEVFTATSESAVDGRPDFVFSPSRLVQMRLLRLDLEEFRIYRRAVLDIPEAGFRLSGANASGKTSLLESIYLLATTRSPRASLERELINWESNQEYGLAPFARVAARVRHDGGPDEDVELTLLADTGRPSSIRKRAKMDGRPCRITDLVGALKVVLFSPEDLNLVLGSPSVRRRFLDISISQLDRAYLRALSRYGKLVERRNSLLKALGAHGTGRSAEEELAFWDDEFTTYSAYLLAARYRYLSGLSHDLTGAFSRLNPGELDLHLSYSGTVEMPEAQIERAVAGTIADAQPLFARAIGSQLRERRSEELRRGSTVIGPHRDDFSYLINGRDLSAYGSRGQQRLAVVATKQAELARVIDVTGEAPLLLLDDVLSELDPSHQDGLLRVLGDTGCQIIVTATSRELLDHPALEDLPLAEVTRGVIGFEDEGARVDRV